MDLKLLHPITDSDRNYRMKDKLNSKASSVACGLLEWSGWYNQDIYQRLLGHYRLFQLYKKEHKEENSIPLPLSYIINYRLSHNSKFLFSRIVGGIYYVGTFGKPYKALQTENFNKLLLTEYPDILNRFLTNADTDFDAAFLKAIEEIATLDFPAKFGNPIVQQAVLLVQHRNEYKSYNNSTHYFNEYNTVQTAAGIKGKEKGVFSKRQILILFDLLAETSKLEKIDFSKPNRFDAIADLLVAITGKSKESWIEELKDWRNKELYAHKDEGELKQLIITITNLSDTLRTAGFRSLSKVADKKLIELQRLKN